MVLAHNRPASPDQFVKKTPSGRERLQKVLGSLSADLDIHLTLAQTLAPILAGGLDGKPRQCKRFLNTFVIRQRMAKSRGITLKPSVLAKLMLLEHFRPETFRTLSELQADQKGHPKQLAFLEKGTPAVQKPEPEAEESDAEGATKKPGGAQAGPVRNLVSASRNG
jgi:hypothetical protein